MAQERFFSFTEGWASYATIEDEHTYTVIGMNFTSDPTFIKYLQFSIFDKSGDFLSEWDYRIDSIAVTTEIRNQQSFSNFEEKYIIGITTKSPPDFVLNAEYLKLNHEASQIVERSALLEDAIMYITQQLGENKILHATDHFNDDKVISVMFETDTFGNLIWESNFSCEGSCWMQPRHIIPTHDGGYIFTNTERRLVGGTSVDNHDVSTIIKVDSIGEQEWRIHPGGLGLPYTSEYIVLQPTDDGNYLCAWADNFWRTSEVNIHYQRNPDATIWFAKIDPDGNKLWEKNIQEEIELWDVDDFFYNMEQMIRTADSNFVFISDDRLFKINQEAEVIWARILNPLGFESSPEQEFYLSCFGLNQTSDGGYICTGDLQIYSGDIYPEFIQTGFVLKLDEYGCFEEGCQEDDPIVGVEEVTQAVSKLAIYPNPTNRDITIEYHLPDMPDQLRLSIHNLTGEVVHTQSLFAHAGSVRVELSEYLPAGAYFCHLAVGGEVLGVKRFVLVR